VSQKMLNRKLKEFTDAGPTGSPGTLGHCFTQHSLITQVNSLSYMCQVFSTQTKTWWNNNAHKYLVEPNKRTLN